VLVVLDVVGPVVEVEVVAVVPGVELLVAVEAGVAADVLVEVA